MPQDRKIQIRRDSAADWASTDPVLAEGELGYETDTGKGKFGDGTTAWSSLSYVTNWGSGGGVSDGDKGDITVSSSGTVWTIDDEVVTFAKMQHIATDSFIGRNTTGTGDIEVLSVGTVRTLLNVEDGADVTDETNVTDALDGATLTDVGTPASDDLVLLQDVSDSNILKVAQFSEFGGGGGASQLLDLSDVNTSTPTNRNVLVADGVDFESRALVEADISDLGSYVTASSSDTFTNKSGNISQWTNDFGYTTNIGTVTSVAVSGSDGIDVDSGSPIISGGTIALGINASTLRTHINVEDGADVTDTANVTAAGALMDSEVDADIKTLSLPANTTISTFGASLIDDASASAARTTLDVDQAGTDNSPTSAPAAYTLSTSHNITTTVSTIPFDTEEFDPDTNYSNSSGEITATLAGYYHVDINVPVNDDGSSGATRGRVFIVLQRDQGTSTWIDVSNIRGQDYHREASGGSGVHAAGIVQLAASEVIRVRIDVSSSTDVSTETGEASINIHRIRAS